MTDTRPSIELFVRSLTPSGTARQQETILEQLADLEERGTVEEYSLTVWGEQVDPESHAAETAHGQRILDTVAEFETWAEENGVSVERFFEDQSIESTVTGERYTARRLPVFAMAEYVDGELAYVTPHEVAGDVETVNKRLEELTARTDPPEERIVASVA